MLNLFYKCTLIVLKTIQIDIHLKFYEFNYMFDRLKKLKNTIMINIAFFITWDYDKSLLNNFK